MEGTLGNLIDTRVLIKEIWGFFVIFEADLKSKPLYLDEYQLR